jgi:carbohydrate-binding DOMON domain-containing protein
MTEPPPSSVAPVPGVAPATADILADQTSDAATIASYKKTFNLTVLTVARGWADHLRARPAKTSGTAIGVAAIVLLGVNGWLDPATVQSLFSAR